MHVKAFYKHPVALLPCQELQGNKVQSKEDTPSWSWELSVVVCLCLSLIPRIDRTWVSFSSPGTCTEGDQTSFRRWWGNRSTGGWRTFVQGHLGSLVSLSWPTELILQTLIQVSLCPMFLRNTWSHAVRRRRQCGSRASKPDPHQKEQAKERCREVILGVGCRCSTWRLDYTQTRHTIAKPSKSLFHSAPERE